MSPYNFSRASKRGNDRNVLLTIISILIALGSLSSSIYFALFYEDKPNITLEIMNESNVLDIHEPLEDLTVLFEKKDILRSNLNIRIFTIRIANSGKDVLEIHYDKNDSWGFRVENGDIVRIGSLYGSISYSDLEPKTMENKVEFKNILFEKGDYFFMDVFVLHDKDTSPSIETFENIAGIDKIEVVDKRKEQKLKECLNEREVVLLVLGIGVAFAIVGGLVTFWIMVLYTEKRYITIAKTKK